MKIVFFGTPEFAVPSLKILLGSEHEVIAVVTQPDRQSGRGRRFHLCPVKAVAEEAGIKVLQPLKVREQKFIDELKQLNPSVIVVVAYGQILPPEIIHMPEFGCLNVHASLLPKYRGAAPINKALIEGEEKTGVMTMLMDEGMDTGPLLLKEETKITREDTAGSLSEKLSETGAARLILTLEGLEKGNLKPMPQEGEPSYAPLMKKSDGLIQWTLPAEEICNFIRGMNPWPGAYGFIGEERFKILMAFPVEGGGGAGLIENVTKDELLVAAGRGRISITEIQPSGKPVMEIRAFLQGRKLEKGMRFNSDDQKFL
ncbi:MAG TPA: methionyl-tRNA formyltransferase [Nitrospirae bacterium]|nr:methionyl-tRNA formyltransferase [Nitrospirota bacterium]